MELYREESSVVLRYAAHVRDLSPSVIASCSIAEGARIVELPGYQDVAIDVLDLSTLSATGTFKDWVACLTVAACQQRGVPLFFSESSGNTGNALSLYAARAGVRCVILYPTACRGKIRDYAATLPNVRLIEVGAPEAVIKSRLAEISGRVGIPWLPVMDGQLESNKLRAFFLRDAARELGREWEWHAQALSSGYGVFGFYRGVAEIQDRDGLAAMRPPRLLGVQQQAVCPYARALADRPVTDGGAMVEPTLFRAAPPEAFVREIRRICAQTAGTVLGVTNEEFFAREPAAIALLEAGGIGVEIDPCTASPRERAGLYALTGVMHAVDHETIEPGSRVLVVFTGGAPVAGPGVGLSAASARPVPASEETLEAAIFDAVSALEETTATSQEAVL
jgi:threonine synthase